MSMSMSSPSPSPALLSSQSPPSAGTILSYLIVPISSAVAVSLLAGFAIVATRFRLWHRSRFLTAFLGVVSSPLYLLFAQFLLLALKSPEFDEFDVAAAVLLYVLFSSYLSTTVYTLDRHNRFEEVTAQERTHLITSFNLLWLILISSYATSVKSVLIAIWSLSLLKIAVRALSVVDSEKKYGVENTNLVAFHMESDEVTGSEACRYIVAGEEDYKVGEGYKLSLKNEAAITTVDDVWRCRGWVMNGDRKDLCLSFALFKLFKRWFQGYPMPEASMPATRRHAREIFVGAGASRAFAVVECELKFFLDVFYTKFSITFGFFVFFLNALTVLATAATVFLGKSQHDLVVRQGKNVFRRLFLAEVLVGLVVAVELTHFIRYAFSDWAKVLWLAKYCKEYAGDGDGQPTLREKLLGAACRRPLARTLCTSISQYSLFDNVTPVSSRLLPALSGGLIGRNRKVGRVERRRVKLTGDVKESIYAALKSLLQTADEDGVEPRLTNGSSALRRHGLYRKLGWACQSTLVVDGEVEHLRSPMYTIFVWHIATGYCAMARKFDGGGGGEETPSQQVAAALSNYCAHLAVFHPDLLPKSILYTHKKFFRRLLGETRKFFGVKREPRKVSEEEMFERMKGAPPETEPTTIVARGARLGREIMSEVGDEKARWEMLEEVWAEMLLYLAPSEDPRAHEKRLLDGGELITIVWAFLYHAGVLARPHDAYADEESKH